MGPRHWCLSWLSPCQQYMCTQDLTHSGIPLLLIVCPIQLSSKSNSHPSSYSGHGMFSYDRPSLWRHVLEFFSPFPLEGPLASQNQHLHSSLQRKLLKEFSQTQGTSHCTPTLLRFAHGCISCLMTSACLAVGELRRTEQVLLNPISPLQSPPNCPIELPRGFPPTSRKYFPLTAIVQDVCPWQDPHFQVIDNRWISKRRLTTWGGGGYLWEGCWLKLHANLLALIHIFLLMKSNSTELKVLIIYNQLKCREI